MDESLDRKEGLGSLKALRDQVGNASSTKELRTIHRQISRIVARLQGVRIEEIAEALDFTIEKYRRGRRLRVYRALKAARPDILAEPKVHEELQDQIDELGEAGVYLEESEEVIVPPNKDRGGFFNGEGSSEIDKQIHQRLVLIKDVLKNLGIDLFECSFKYGKVENDMMRKTPYILVVVPQLNKMVLVCDEEGNRTFVIAGTSDQQKYIEMNKAELKDDDRVRHFIWTSDIEHWKARLAGFLKEPFGEKVISKPFEQPSQEEKKDVIGMKMTAEYYTPENVRADLLAYVKELGEGKTVYDLGQTNMKKNRAVCCNGELVSGRAYLYRAVRGLGLAQTEEESHSKLSKALIELLKLAGYDVEECVEMDEDYFTKENVAADLQVYANLCGENKTFQDLTFAKNIKGKAKCCNGDEIMWNTYLHRVARAFGHAKKGRSVYSKRMEAFEELMHIMGIEGYQLLKPEYYTPENVKADLEAYAQELGEGKTPLNLSTWNISQLSVMCMTKYEVKGDTYLKNAGKFLGLTKGAMEAGTMLRLVLNELLKLAGYDIEDYEKMKAPYYTPENVQADLLTYAKAIGVDDPSKINHSTIYDVRVLCQSGEAVRGETYLERAGVALGFAEKNTDAKPYCKEIYKKLLERAGYELAEIDDMAAEYYTPEVVKKDLEAYAALLKGNKEPLDLNPGNINSLEITCQNGEDVKGGTYLRRAAVAFGHSKTTTKGAKKRKEALVDLLKRAGYDVPEYSKMNKEYFTSEVVKKDLEKFAREYGKDFNPIDLNAKKMRGANVLCQNGEFLSGNTYLLRASVALGYAENTTEGDKMKAEILDILIELAGFEVPIYNDMDVEYFTSENVIADLKLYTVKVLGEDKTPEDLTAGDDLLSAEVVCSNGETVCGRVYLKRASEILLESDTSKRSALNKLLEIAGYEVPT